MEYSLLLDSEAVSDLEEAASWYENQKQGLGGKFLLSFGEAIELLKKHPHLCSIVYEKFRRMLMSSFPYAIYYSIDESEKIVEVIGIFHTRRNPEIWQERIQLK